MQQEFSEDGGSSVGRSFRAVSLSEVIEETNQHSNGTRQSPIGIGLMRSLPLFTMLQVSRAEMEEEFDMNVVALISILDKYTLSMKVELFSTGGVFSSR